MPDSPGSDATFRNPVLASSATGAPDACHQCGTWINPDHGTRHCPDHAPAPTRVQDALRFAATLAELDARERSLTGRGLDGQDRDWDTMAGEVIAALNCAVAGGPGVPPDMAGLESAGARLLNLYGLAVRAWMVRVDAGADEDEALAA